MYLFAAHDVGDHADRSRWSMVSTSREYMSPRSVRSFLQFLLEFLAAFEIDDPVNIDMTVGI